MLVLMHVIIALSSIVYAGISFFAPSKKKLRVAYGLVAATLASGTYLVITTHAPMIEACKTGLIYLGVVMLGLIPATIKAYQND